MALTCQIKKISLFISFGCTRSSLLGKAESPSSLQHEVIWLCHCLAVIDCGMVWSLISLNHGSVEVVWVEMTQAQHKD